MTAAHDASPAPTKTAAEALEALASDRASGLTRAEATARLDRSGPNEVAERPRHPILRLLRRFWGLSAWMIELIAILSFLLHKRADTWIALALLVVNAVLGSFQEQRASRAVQALRRKLQVTARVLRDGAWQAVPARQLVVGDVVRVRAGDLVPADVQLLDGALRVDQSSLTGESRDVDAGRDATVHAGSTARDGEATGVVVATGARTSFGRTTELVEAAHPRLHIEEVTGRIVRWLLAIVGALSAVTFVVALLRGVPLVEVAPVALVLLMSAVPIALPVMFTVSMAMGSMDLGRRGVLITRLGAIEDAASMDVLCADKTGTLTMNRPSLAGTLPQPGFTGRDVVLAGALGSNEADADPIDAAFLRSANDRQLHDATARILSFAPFSAKSRRTEAVVEIAGVRTRLVKGALRTVAVAAGLDAAAVAALEVQAEERAQEGVRAIAVARADGDGPLRLCGLALFHDAPRPDSRRLIDELRALGIKVFMLTGDGLAVGRETARALGLGEITRAPGRDGARRSGPPVAPDLAGGGLAEVFPEDKFRVVEALQAAGHVVGMTGDGVNDAPALRQAEVGIAVSGAADAAKGAASAVLTTEGLANIVELVRSGRGTYERILTWILNKISRSILKAGFVVIAFLVTGRFVISALVMLLLVCLTDLTHVALATDRVEPSPRPETWNIRPLVRVAAVLGVLTLAEALGLLAFAWRRFGLADDAGQLQTFTFQTFLFLALFSLVSVRERRPFWRSRPSAALVATLTAALLGGVLIGAYGVAELSPLPIGRSAAILAYAAAVSLGPNDVVKAWLTRRVLGGAARLEAMTCAPGRGRAAQVAMAYGAPAAPPCPPGGAAPSPRPP